MCKYFQQEEKDERAILVSKMRNLTFNNLNDYIDSFKGLFSEYEGVNGDAENEEIYEAFMNGLPRRRYDSQRTNLTKKNLSTALAHFKTIANDERKYQTKSENGNGRKSFNNNRFRKDYQNVSLNKVNTSRVPKCYSCGGYGHRAKDCATKQKLCINCGSDDHLKKDCTVRIYKVQHSELREVSDPESDDEEAEETCSVTANQAEDQFD